MMTMTKNQTTTMTLWSKYTPFKYYYLVKTVPNQLGMGRIPQIRNSLVAENPQSSISRPPFSGVEVFVFVVVSAYVGVQLYFGIYMEVNIFLVLVFAFAFVFVCVFVFVFVFVVVSVCPVIFRF